MVKSGMIPNCYNYAESEEGGGFIAVLFNAAKDQQTKITSLEARITTLEKGAVKP